METGPREEGMGFWHKHLGGSGRSGAGESSQKKQHQGPPGEEPTHWLGPINECVGRFLWCFLGKNTPKLTCSRMNQHSMD